MKKNTCVLVALLFLLPALNSNAGDVVANLKSYLTDNLVETAKPSGPAEHFVGKKLFDYMNGGAERYLAYGFTDIVVRGYQKGETKANIEIYHMAGPQEAFGVYAFAAKSNKTDIGIPSSLGRGMLSFHKGDNYVRIVAMSNAPKAAPLLIALAKKLQAKMPGKSEIPPELKNFPEGAQPGSYRFLPNPETARTVWFDGEEDVLLTKGARAYSALYTVGDDDLLLTKTSYSSKPEALKTCQALAKKLSLKAEDKDGKCFASGKTPDDAFATLETTNNVLRWVGGASEQKIANTWIEKIK
jgi:hypothetical protein